MSIIRMRSGYRRGLDPLPGFAGAVESRQPEVRTQEGNHHMNEELAAYITRLCELSGHTTWIKKDLILVEPG